MPTVTFGADQSFGAISNFEEQSSSVEVKKDRAAVLDHVGNEAVSKLYNTMTEVSTQYKATSAAGSIALPCDIGEIVNELAVTNITVSTSGTDFVGLTLQGHQHGSNEHTSLRTGDLSSYSLTSGYGCTDFMAGTSGSDATAASSTLTVTVNHVDQLDNNGNEFIGENFDAKIQAETSWIGVPSVAAGGGWDNVSTKTETDAQGFVKTVVTGVKTIALS